MVMIRHIAVLTAAYFISGKLGLLLAVPPGYATLVFPASGVGLAAVLLYGNRLLPAVWLGSFLLNLSVAYETSTGQNFSSPAFLPALIATGALLQAALGGYLVRRFVRFPALLEQGRDIYTFFALAGPVSCLVGASIGTTALLAHSVITITGFRLIWLTWWSGDVMGVFVVAPLALIWLGKPRDLWRRRRFTVGLPLIGFFIFLTIGYVQFSGKERLFLQNEFERRADAITSALQTTALVHTEILDSVGGFFKGSDSVTRREFRLFVDHPLMSHGSLQALEWIPRVRASERRRYETRARDEGFRGFRITEKAPDGRLTTAGSRSEYFPAYYVEPYRGNEAALGYDLSSNSARFATMQKSIDTARPAATAPLLLVQEKQQQPGILIFYPVFAKNAVLNTVDDRREAVQGFGLAVCRVENLIVEALKGHSTTGVRLTVYDGGGEVGGVSPPAAALWTNELPQAPSAGTDRRLRYGSTIAIADRQWSLAFASTPEFLAGRSGVQSGPFAAALVLGAGLFTIFLFVVSGYESATAKLVQEKTAELTLANEALETSRESLNRAQQVARIGSWQHAIRSDELHWSAETCRIFGVTRGEPVTRERFLSLVHAEDRDSVSRSWQDPLHGQPAEIEHRIVVDGRVKWVNARTDVMFNDSGEPSMVFGTVQDITDRKRAEEALQASEERYRDLFELSPLPMWVFAEDSLRFLAVNDAALGHYGFTRGEFLAMTLRDVRPPEDVSGLETWLASGAPGFRKGERRHRRKDGTLLIVDIWSKPIHFDGQQARLTVIHDITERKQAEEALRKSRLDLLAILNNLPFLAWLKDTDGRFITANQPLALSCGLSSPEDVNGRTDFDVWPRHLAERYRADDEEVIRTRQQKSVEEFVADRGVVKWFETYKSPLFDPHGRVTGTTGFSRDITDRKRAEESLLKRINFESAIAAVSGDFAGRIAPMTHRGIERALGIIGKTVKADRSYLFLFCGDSMDNTHEWCDHGISSESGQLQNIPRSAFPWLMARLERFETVPIPRVRELPEEAASERREFERERIQSLLLVPVACSGRLHGFIGFDAVREEREWSPDDLRLLKMVAGIFGSALERKQAEDDILRERHAADAANRAKTEFLANMSHEIRTPMNAILGLIDLVLDTQLSENQRANLEMVSQSAGGLLTLLNQVLDLSKIEAGKMEMHETDFNLMDALDAALNPFRLQARRKGIALSYGVDPAVPGELRGDAGFLRQVVTNLVGNAIKFTERGEVSLLVGPGGRSEDGRNVFVRIDVSDTGIGIPEEKRGRIFESFTQADGSVTRKYGGTGLGLAISKRLVEFLGGRLSVESAVGKGSTFSFTARFGVPESVPVARHLDNGSAPSLSGRRFGALRVLLGEDNVGNQELVRQALTKRGHSVSIAGNGKEVLSRLKQGTFDVVLMDIQMPEMDGVQALNAIRGNPVFSRSQRTPVIALTAHAFESDRERFIKAGFNGYLAKPFTVPDLTRIVEEAASRGPVDGTPAREEGERRQDDARDPPIDVDEVLQRLDGDREILQTILKLYREDTPALVASLEQALAERLPPESERHAHSVKSVSGNIGARRMSQCAAEIEQHAREGSLEEAAGSLPELREELARVLEQIPSLLKEVNP